MRKEVGDDAPSIDAKNDLQGDEIICNLFGNKRITNRITQVSSYELTTD
jgi:hypothetical protein